eukprot:765328-Hanusia_phi.AAC.5
MDAQEVAGDGGDVGVQMLLPHDIPEPHPQHQQAEFISCSGGRLENEFLVLAPDDPTEEVGFVLSCLLDALEEVWELRGELLDEAQSYLDQLCVGSREAIAQSRASEAAAARPHQVPARVVDEGSSTGVGL